MKKISVLVLFILFVFSLYAFNTEFIGNYDTDGSSKRVYVSENYAYIADGYTGVCIVDVSDPANMSGVGYYESYNYAADVYVVDTLAYIADRDTGLVIVNVSDPSNPLEVGYCVAGSGMHTLYIEGNYVYAGGDDSTFIIINISDPENPIEVGTYKLDDNPEDIYVSGNYAYVADNAYGLCIIDISDPANPTEIGHFSTAGYGYGIYVVGNYAYLAHNYKGLRIIDVSDPANPTEVGYYDTNSTAYSVYVVGNYAYVGDGGDGLRIIDVSDPTNPIEVAYYDPEGWVWDVFVKDNYVYMAVGSDGMDVVSYNGYIILENFNSGLYYPGKIDTIEWMSDTSIYEVIVSYTIDNGSTWSIIDTVNNSGKYVWEIPNVDSDSCRVKVQSSDYDYIYDMSDSVFSIKELSWFTPEEGDTLERGLYCSITWESYLSNTYISIFYSVDNGSSWNIMVDSTENDGEYDWYVDTDTLGVVFLRLILRDNATIYEDKVRFVNVVDYVEITSPNGGEELEPNSICRIEWESDDSVVDYANIYYSIDNGETWTLIKGGVLASLHYYDWTVPDIETDNALIKIEDYNNNAFYDVSDNVFKIGNTSIKDLKNIYNITIPTLSTNGIAVKYELTNSSLLRVKIYDSAGRLIKDEKLQFKRGKGVQNIPVNSKGIYFVKIYDDKNKLIKEGKISVVK